MLLSITLQTIISWGARGWDEGGVWKVSDHEKVPVVRMAKGYWNSSGDEHWGETQGRELCPTGELMMDGRRVTTKRVKE